MRVTVFIFMFGLVLILGLFLSVFWTKSVIVRWSKVKRRWHWHEDRALILSSGIALSSIGLVLVYGSRLLFNLFYDLSPMLQGAEAWPVAAGLAFLLSGHLLLVWLADLEIEPPRWGWLKAMCVVSIGWLALSIHLAPLVPLYPGDVNTIYLP
ncbi:MAG: hypothetical protein H0T60_06825 [Acidobacteria bacterium]|nr:hypothetical protein [Acidobacteriota bacterium]